ncbi:MAG: hypothetical protein ACI4II_02330 [Acutalibacteraceae bacterium]
MNIKLLLELFNTDNLNIIYSALNNLCDGSNPYTLDTKIKAYELSCKLVNLGLVEEV